MQPEMVLISRELVEKMILQLDSSATICENARSMTEEDLRTDFRLQDPGTFYSGANGMARVVMRDTLQVLESHLG
jgi:hypothetical protein